MDILGSNISILRKKNKISQKELAKKLNVGSSTISAYENQTAFPAFKGLLKLADIFNVSLDELVYTDMLNGNNNAKKGSIPYYYLPASAGEYDILANDCQPDAFYNIPELQNCDAILPVIGNSMDGVINAGDLIAIKEFKEYDIPDPENPYLIITHSNRMIKFISFSNDKETIIARSANKNIQDILIPTIDIKKVYMIKGLLRFFF